MILLLSEMLSGLGLENNEYNRTTFDPVQTTKLRLRSILLKGFPEPFLNGWYFRQRIPLNHPPIAIAGVDRSVIIGGKTYLSGKTKSVTPVTKITWEKKSGPGNVVFDQAGRTVQLLLFSPQRRIYSKHDSR